MRTIPLGMLGFDCGRESWSSPSLRPVGAALLLIALGCGPEPSAPKFDTSTLAGVYSRRVAASSGGSAAEELELLADGSVSISYEDCERRVVEQGHWYLNERGYVTVEPDDGMFDTWQGYPAAPGYEILTHAHCRHVGIAPLSEGLPHNDPSEADHMGRGRKLLYLSSEGVEDEPVCVAVEENPAECAGILFPVEDP